MKKLLSLSILLFINGVAAQAQDAITHAHQVLDLLRQGKAADVAREFDATMTAGLPPQVLAQVWPGLQAQAGAYKSELGQQSAGIRGGTAVTLGLQFERAALNMVVVFDANNKISGLNFAPRPLEAPAASLPAGLTEEPMTVGTGTFALPGTLTLPSGTGRAAAVVLVHGSGPEDRDETIGANKPFRDLAWGLAARGIAVLRYEKRTKQHGEKMVNLNITVRDETIDDAVLAVKALRQHSRIDGTHVFVIGHSLGGMVVPRIAQEDRTIAGLIILAGNSRPLPELMVEQTEYIASISPNPTAQQATIAAMKQQAARVMDPALPLTTPASELMGVPASYWKDLNAYKPAAVAATLTVPMLILQGERDYQVTMKDFEGWREALKGRANVTPKSYPNLNHLFIAGTGKSTPAEYQNPGKVAEQVIDDIVQIPGTKQTRFLEDNATAPELSLDRYELDALTEVFRPDAVAGERYPPGYFKTLGI